MGDQLDQSADGARKQPNRSIAQAIGNGARLAVSRNPLQLKRSFRQLHSVTSSSPEESQELSGQRPRFQAGAQWVVDAVNIRQSVESIGSGGGADRFAAAVDLSRHVENHPHRDSIRKALKKKSEKSYKGFWDCLTNELYLFGQKVFDKFTPSALNTHSTYFTATFTLIVCVVFFFMAAEFPRYVQEQDLRNLPSTRIGPKGLTDWIVKTNNQNYEFSSDYLEVWGGRYSPDMANGKEAWRWLTSLILHVNFIHLISNLIPFVLFSLQLEHKYGIWRIGLLTLMAGIGGNFLSAAFEDGCSLVVGASGCCFGLLGLYVADMAVNFETITFPLLRVILFIGVLILNIYTSLTEKNLSFLSHLGGFLTGLFPSLVFLPNLQWEKYEASFPFLGGATILFFFVFLPTYIYLVQFPNGECEGLVGLT